MRCSETDFLAEGLIPGVNYYLRVYTFDTLGSATFNICVGTPPPAPPNDDCSNATMLTVNADLFCGAVLNATTSGGSPGLAGCSGTADDEVWYQFVATGSSHRVKITGGAQSLVAEAFSSTCGNLNLLACISPQSGNIEEQLNGLLAGQTYYLEDVTPDCGIYELTSSHFTPDAPKTIIP